MRVVDETGSTNADLLAAAAAGVPDRSVLAARHQWYPGMEYVGHRTVRFETNHYFDVLRMLNYVT